MAQLGLGLIVLLAVLSILPGVGKIVLIMFVNAVTLGWIDNPTRLAHRLVALAFWTVEIKSLFALWRQGRRPIEA